MAPKGRPRQRHNALQLLYLLSILTLVNGFTSRVLTIRPRLASLEVPRRLPCNSAPTRLQHPTRLQATGSKERPEWARKWMPTWMFTMKPREQLLVALALYVFHLKVLTQNAIAFPFQLFPNNMGRFQSIGLDSLAGIFTLVGYLSLRKSKRKKQRPWKFPPIQPNSIKPGPRSTGVIGLLLLIQAYFFTGRFSIFWEDVFYAAAGVGFPLTIAMHRSLCVMMGHFTWVAIGALILRIVPRPQPFFGGGFDENEEGDEKVQRKYKWFTSAWKDNWVWWTVGGYFVSSWAFNISDFVNQVVLPPEVLEATAEGVVAQLINPEHNDLAASIVGCIAPCLSAPWWEEVLYRGFMLPAMCLHMPYWLSVFLSGVVFSAHHISATGAIPLAVLGWTWAAIYARSGNLLVTILIHAFWNSRVFLGSWLGL